MQEGGGGEDDGGGGGEWYLLHFKPLQKLSVSPRLTLCLLSAGYRRRRVIKHGSRQRRAAEKKKKKKAGWATQSSQQPMGRTDIMKPGAVSGRHQTDETDAWEEDKV